MNLYLKVKVSTVTILNYVWYLIKVLLWIVLHNLLQHCESRIIFNTVLWFSKATPVRLKCIHTLFSKGMLIMGALDSSMIQTIAHWSQRKQKTQIVILNELFDRRRITDPTFIIVPPQTHIALCYSPDTIIGVCV